MRWLVTLIQSLVVQQPPSATPHPWAHCFSGLALLNSSQCQSAIFAYRGVHMGNYSTIFSSEYSGGPFSTPFFAGALFCTFLVLPKPKKIHSRISEKMTKSSDYVFFIWVIFLLKREIFAYFCLYFQIFYVLISKILQV